MLKTFIDLIIHRDEGHAPPALAALIGAVGAIVLTAGATTGTDWLTWVGGIMLALGVLAANVVDHVTVDYNIYARLEELEK
jgi:hypothetical protein